MAETVEAREVGAFRVVQDGATGKTLLILDYADRPSLALVFSPADAGAMAHLVLQALEAQRQRATPN